MKTNNGKDNITESATNVVDFAFNQDFVLGDSFEKSVEKYPVDIKNS